MVESRFCYRVRVRNKLILYSTLSGAVVGFKLDDSDDVISILDQGGSTNHVHKELVDLLMSYLFLVPSHELELDWMKTRLIDGNKMKRSDTLRLVIAPTTSVTLTVRIVINGNIMISYLWIPLQHLTS